MSTPPPNPYPSHGYPAPAHPSAPRTNGLAIATLVLGICGFALIPIIMGHIALKQIRERGESGGGMAIAGLILGYIALAGYVILIVAVIIAVAGGVAFGAR